MSTEEERVKIWNTFFNLAWEEAKSLHEICTGIESKKKFDPVGGTLPDEEFHQLSILVLCNLAIEARVNHLLDELKEKKIITEDIVEAVQWLPTKHKWFLLPELAKKSVKLDSSKMPHQAIKEICNRRNELLHVKYEELLRKKLPTSKKTLSLFDNFVKAMENMNVVLDRIPKERDDVISIGKF